MDNGPLFLIYKKFNLQFCCEENYFPQTLELHILILRKLHAIRQFCSAFFRTTLRRTRPLCWKPLSPRFMPFRLERLPVSLPPGIQGAQLPIWHRWVLWQFKPLRQRSLHQLLRGLQVRLETWRHCLPRPLQAECKNLLCCQFFCCNSPPPTRSLVREKISLQI